MTMSRIVILPFFLILVWGCQPSPKLEELVQDMVVQTDYEETTNFGSYSTFTLPLDTLGLISNNYADTLILNDFAKEATAKIKANMNSAGFTYVESNQDPDLGITAFIVNDFSVFQSISYPNYYGGYYSPYYGYYYPIVNTYTSNSGILIIQLTDLRKKNIQNQFQVVWAAYIGDIISSVNAYQKALEGIDQAYVQSPFLKK